jgi:hypothetical protein
MKKLIRPTVFLAAAALVFGCVPESDGDGGGGGNNNGAGGMAAGAGGMPGGGGPANEVNARVEGGSSAGDVSGVSEMSVPNQFHASVAAGDLIVFLTSGNGVVQFTLDTNDQSAPGAYPVNEELDVDADLSIVSPTGIRTGTGGNIVLDNCPNDGARVTGRFDGVSLVNVATGAPDGTLSGTFAATIVSSDGSANCVEEPMMMGGGGIPGGGDGPSPGPMCPNDACDGPCCPLLDDLFNCSNECIPMDAMEIPDFAALVMCLVQCEQILLDDPACGPKFRDLTGCIDENMCERSLEDNPCLAENCCDEFKAAL